MDEDKKALRDWADKIITLRAEEIAVVLDAAKRLVADSRLSSSDRDFAQAQIRAINQARRTQKRSKPPEP